jgi:Holliday junction resolvase
MNESEIQKEIINYLESNRYYVVKVIRANKNGVPDILFCKDGKFCAIEVKAKGKKSNVSELQKVHIHLINASGGKAIVADCLYDVMEEF